MNNQQFTLKLRTLCFGDMGKDVKLIQRILRSRGIKDEFGKRCNVTGVLTHQTMYIINKVQNMKHLKKRKYVDMETWLAILEV